MTIETATYISQLDTTLPTASDLISEGDDHLRLTKTVLKTQFPNFGTTAIAASAAEVNYSVGVTSSIQTQLNSKAPTVSPTFTGTAALPATTSIGTVSDVEIATLYGVTSSIQTQINGKGSVAGQTWTGAHSFSGATSVPTLAAGTSTTGAASTAFVQTEWTTRLPNYSVPITASSTELNYSVGVTSGVQGQINTKGAIAGQNWTGTHDYTAGDLRAATLPSGTNTTAVATTAHVAAMAFAAALPAQTGNAGKFVTTDGNNASWTNALVASSINGGQLAGLRNKIINGGFSVNQRAYVSGAATTAGQYLFDRWKVTGTGGVTFSTTANKTTVTIPSGQTLQQVIEGLNLQTGTYVLSWEGTAQGRIGGGSYGVSGAVTAAVTGGTNTTIEFNTGTVTGIQLELGTVATPFEHRPYGMELALCQRYYYRNTSSGGDAFGVAQVFSSTQAYAVSHFPVTLRVSPASLEQTGIAADYSLSGSACSAVPALSGASNEHVGIAVFTLSGGLTANTCALALSSGAGKYLGWSAEL